MIGKLEEQGEHPFVQSTISRGVASLDPRDEPRFIKTIKPAIHAGQMWSPLFGVYTLSNNNLLHGPRFAKRLLCSVADRFSGRWQCETCRKANLPLKIGGHREGDGHADLCSWRQRWDWQLCPSYRMPMGVAIER